MSPNTSISGSGEVLDQPEVEEGHPPVGLEQVVARVRVAVERPQPVEAAEHEAVDRLGGQVALVLVPAGHHVEADALGQVGRQHPGGRQAGHHVGDVDEGVVAVRVGEELLVAGLVARSRAPRRRGRGSPRPAGRARSPRTPGPSRRTRGPAASRSASMAWSTPGYWTFTATARSSWVIGAVDLADRRRGERHRVPLGEGDVGRGAELALDDAGRQLGRHRRCVLLQVGQGGAGVVGQPDVEVRRHLAELHEGALHAAERLGDLLGRAQLERLVELGLPLGRGEHPAGPVDGEAGAGAAAHPGQLDAALAAGAGHHGLAAGGRRRAARRRCGRSAPGRGPAPGARPPPRPPRPRPPAPSFPCAPRAAPYSGVTAGTPAGSGRATSPGSRGRGAP